MKANKTILIFCGMLVFACITAPVGLVAQQIDLTGERAPGAGIDVDATDNANQLDTGDELSKPADTWPKGDYVIFNGTSEEPLHLGPTGLWGFAAGQNIWVNKITAGSPADGKVLPGDVIYGANGKGFPPGRGADYSFAMRITEAETKEGGGKLVLSVRRNGQFIQVPIQLKVMGTYSPTAPWNCEKTKNIIAGAEDYMRKGLRPETGLPDEDEYMFAPWHDSVFFLLATGNPEMQGLVRRYILNTKKGVDAYKAGQKAGAGVFEGNKGWGFP